MTPRASTPPRPSHLRLVSDNRTPIAADARSPATLAVAFDNPEPEQALPCFPLLNRKAGSWRDIAPEITFSEDGPIGWLDRMAWRRSAGCFNRMSQRLCKDMQKPSGQRPPSDRIADDMEELDEALVQVFRIPSPTREDFRNKLRLLAAWMGVKEPGTLHAGEQRRYGHFPASALLFERLIDALYEGERPAAPVLRRDHKAARDAQ